MNKTLKVLFCLMGAMLLAIVVLLSLMLFKNSDNHSYRHTSVSEAKVTTSQIIGTWCKKSDNGEECIVFGPNGELDVFDETGSVDIPDGATMTYEIVDEVEPHQLYWTLALGDKSERFPYGIYKIEDGKLIVRPSKEIHRFLGGFDMGVIKYEIPTDFGGMLEVYSRQNELTTTKSKIAGHQSPYLLSEVEWQNAEMLTNSERDYIVTNFLQPLIDFHGELNCTENIPRISHVVVEVPKNNNDYGLGIKFEGGGIQEMLFRNRTANNSVFSEGEHELWFPICMGGCYFSDEYRKRYPKVVEASDVGHPSKKCE